MKIYILDKHHIRVGLFSKFVLKYLIRKKYSKFHKDTFMHRHSIAFIDIFELK
jgi:hypothetical protein